MITTVLDIISDKQLFHSKDSEDRYLTNSVTWEQYEALLSELEDAPGFRLTYLDGVLEIVSPSRRHETGKTRIGTLLEIFFEETNTEYFPLGSTTFRAQTQRGGTEPDESYCIGTEKEFPDLAIEVIVTSGGINRLQVYNRLNVKEVWFWQDSCFTLYHLREETPADFLKTYGYEPVSHSELLPSLDVALLTESMQHPTSLLAAKEFRKRLQETVKGA